jgi:hypothetical protein
VPAALNYHLSACFCKTDDSYCYMYCILSAF